MSLDSTSMSMSCGLSQMKDSPNALVIARNSLQVWDSRCLEDLGQPWSLIASSWRMVSPRAPRKLSWSTHSTGLHTYLGSKQSTKDSLQLFWDLKYPTVPHSFKIWLHPALLNTSRLCPPWWMAVAAYLIKSHQVSHMSLKVKSGSSLQSSPVNLVSQTTVAVPLLKA